MAMNTYGARVAGHCYSKPLKSQSMPNLGAGQCRPKPCFYRLINNAKIRGKAPVSVAFPYSWRYDAGIVSKSTHHGSGHFGPGEA